MDDFLSTPLILSNTTDLDYHGHKLVEEVVPGEKAEGKKGCRQGEKAG